MDPLFSRGSRIHANELMQGGGYARDVYTEGGIASVENLLKFLRRVRCPRSLHSTHSFAIHNNPCIYIYIYSLRGIIISAAVLLSMHLS